jgi:hypothetical protein
VKITKSNHRGGFSLIEVIISLGFLTTLIIGMTQMMKGGFDLKDALSMKGKVLHRINNSMGTITNDIKHAFIVSNADNTRNGIGRRTKGVFKIKRGTAGSRLVLTTRTNIPMKAGTSETDMTYVVYELKDSKTASGRKNLVRMDARMLVEDMRDDPSGVIVARNIKEFKLKWWRGDKWEDTTFDSTERDTRNKMPHMVQITLEAWAEDRVDGDGVDESVDEFTETISTVVFIPGALEFKELGEQFKTIKWTAF